MPWTGLFFLVGAAAISGLPLLNGFVSEWLLFQALLQGFQATPTLSRLIFPVAGALLALTSALAAACFVKAFGIDVPGPAARRGSGEGARVAVDDARAAGLPGRHVLRPRARPGLACSACCEGVTASLPGVRPAPEMVRGLFTIAPGPGHFDHLAPPLVALSLLLAAALASALSLGRAIRGETRARRGVAAASFPRGRSTRRPPSRSR